MIHWRRRRMMNIFKTPTLWLKPLNKTNIILLLHCEVRVKDESQAPKFVQKCNFMGIHNDWRQWTMWRRQTGCWIHTGMNPQHQQHEQTVSQTSARGGNQPDTIQSWVTVSLPFTSFSLHSCGPHGLLWHTIILWWACQTNGDHGVNGQSMSRCICDEIKGWAWTLQQQGVWTLDKHGVFFPDYSAMLQFSSVQNGLYTPAKAHNYVLHPGSTVH